MWCRFLPRPSMNQPQVDTGLPALWSPPPTSHPIPPLWVVTGRPRFESRSKCPLAVSLARGPAYLPTPLSGFIPPSPSHRESTRVFSMSTSPPAAPQVGSSLPPFHILFLKSSCFLIRSHFSVKPPFALKYPPLAFSRSFPTTLMGSCSVSLSQELG